MTTDMTKEQLEARALAVGRAIEAAWNGSGSGGQRNDLPPIELSDHECRHIGHAALAADQSRAKPVGEYVRGIEAAAKVADEFAGRPNDWGEAYYKPAAIAAVREIATAIRALQPEAGEGA